MSRVSLLEVSAEEAPLASIALLDECCAIHCDLFLPYFTILYTAHVVSYLLFNIHSYKLINQICISVSYNFTILVVVVSHLLAIFVALRKSILDTKSSGWRVLTIHAVMIRAPPM